MARRLSFLLFLALALAAGQARAQKPPAPQVEADISGELARLYQADQADRDRNWNKFTTEELAALQAQDSRRRERVLEIVRAQQLATADDYFHAAMILQHGDAPNHYLLAHILANVAAFKGHEKGKSLSAASLDRYLASLKQDQFFGTQFQTEGLTIDSLRLHPPLNGLVTEALRKEFNVPPPEFTLEFIKSQERPK